MTALGLHCCPQAFSSCSEQGLFFFMVLRFLIVMLCLLRDTCSRHVCSVVVVLWALLLHSTWNLPGPGIEPMSPALSGKLLSTVTPGSSSHLLLIMLHHFNETVSHQWPPCPQIQWNTNSCFRACSWYIFFCLFHSLHSEVHLNPFL